jgi:uncharacterized protein (TIGR00369 family)
MPEQLEPKPAAASSSTLIRWMGIEDANSAGNVHGGAVMKLCDEAAAIAAIRHCGQKVVTAAMDRMTFNEPVHLGELLALAASVNAVWRTSMEIGVRVEAENARTEERRNREAETRRRNRLAERDEILGSRGEAHRSQG